MFVCVLLEKFLYYIGRLVEKVVKSSGNFSFQFLPPLEAPKKKDTSESKFELVVSSEKVFGHLQAPRLFGIIRFSLDNVAEK